MTTYKATLALKTDRVIWKYLGFTSSMLLHNINRWLFPSKKSIQNTLKKLILTVMETFSY